MVRTLPLGLNDALGLTLDHIVPLEIETVGILDSLQRAAARDLIAQVDSPSIDASLKDGFAVISAEVAHATDQHPVSLSFAGTISAGGRQTPKVYAGTTVRVLTGAKIPPGADAIVAEEFTSVDGDTVIFRKHAEPGRNVLPKGSDVACGDVVVSRGSMLTPGKIGLLAAAGHETIPVVRNPNVSIIATGDEVIAPGQPLREGQLYASNMTTLGGWCRRYGFDTHLRVVKDDANQIEAALQRANAESDAIITSGGAWTGDRDLVAAILERLGWVQMFHRIRIGPGKAVGFGLLNQKPVFILPGGPPSNLMGFLQIALPGLLALAGHRDTGLPTRRVVLQDDLNGRFADWTQFVFGTIEQDQHEPGFHALRGSSRLQSMALAEAVAAIPEGETHLPAGSTITVQMLVS